MVRMAIILLRYLFVYNGAPLHSPIALRLAEVLLPLFDSVRLCAPVYGTRCSLDTLWPMDFNAGAQVGLKEPILRSCFLPFIQDDSQVQLGSMIVFQDMTDLLVEEERNALKSHVHQSLFPLSFHCHDENPHVAEVRTRGLRVFPMEGAQLPPALVPGGLQPPPGLGCSLLAMARERAWMTLVRVSPQIPIDPGCIHGTVPLSSSPSSPETRCEPIVI